MDFNKAALELHEAHRGKIEVVSKIRVASMEDLSTAYTPGVAEPCRKIAAKPKDVYRYTAKGNLVAVVSDGTAILGLGDIGPEAGIPVMEGKAVLFKEFGNVDAFPICLNTKDVDEGTAIVLLAALINALKVVGKEISDVRVVISGAGSAGTAIGKLLMRYGVKHLTYSDRNGVLNRDTALNDAQLELCEVTNEEDLHGTLADALKGADVFIGVSAPGIVTPEMIAQMNHDAIVFPMANPIPEIMPDEAFKGGARIVGTGRSDYPNQINNVLVFPGVFRGALDVRAREITEEMKLAAAKALAALVSDDELCEQFIIPTVLDERAAKAVAKAVADEAIRAGIAQI